MHDLSDVVFAVETIGRSVKSIQNSVENIQETLRKSTGSIKDSVEHIQETTETVGSIFKDVFEVGHEDRDLIRSEPPYLSAKESEWIRFIHVRLYPERNFSGSQFDWFEILGYILYIPVCLAILYGLVRFIKWAWLR